MKNVLKLIVGAVLTTTCAGAQAAIHCEGLVTYALLYADGTVNIMGGWRG